MSAGRVTVARIRIQEARERIARAIWYGQADAPSRANARFCLEDAVSLLAGARSMVYGVETYGAIVVRLVAGSALSLLTGEAPADPKGALRILDEHLRPRREIPEQERLSGGPEYDPATDKDYA